MYFDSEGICWHRGGAGGPTGHLLSSQGACVNPLYTFRQRKDLADAVVPAGFLRSIRKSTMQTNP